MDKSISDKKMEKLSKMSDTSQLFVDYCVKKSEKISTAIYILTNFMAVDEPLKNGLRKKCLKLVSDIFAIKNIKGTENSARLGVFLITSQTIPEILSLISISEASGLISQMNSSILERELGLLSSILSDRFGLNTALLLSKKDFAVRGLESAVVNKNIYNDGYVSIDGYQKESRISKGQKLSTYTKNASQSDKGHFVSKVFVKKADRRAIILELVKDIGGITVKDASLKMPEYSEKTVQRELVNMVKENILKREGKRRWSKYLFA